MKFEIFPISIFVLFFVSGILLGTFLQVPTSILIVGICVNLILLFLLHFTYRKLKILPFLFKIGLQLLFLQLGILTLIAHQSVKKVDFFANYLKSSPQKIELEIVDELKHNQYNQQYVAQFKQLDNHKVSGKVLIKIPTSDSISTFETGQILIAESTIIKVPRQKNPHQFEYANYLANKDIFYETTLSKSTFLVVGKQISWSQKVSKIRKQVAIAFDATKMQANNKGIAKALLIGLKQDVDKQTATQYAEVGAIHLLAISGLHVSILMYLFLFVLSPLKKMKYGNFIQTLILLGCLWGFAFLAGLSASVVRSVTMFSFVGIGILISKRGKDIYNTLAISALLLLIFQPYFLFDVGFQLSYSAVLSIVTFQPYLSKILRKPNNKYFGYFHDIFTVSLAAQLGVMPLSLYYFHQFPGLFFLTNIVVIPLVTIILGFGIGALIFAFFTSIPTWLAFILDFFLSLMNSFIGWISSFESFVIRDIPMDMSLVITSSLVFILLGFCVKKGFKNHLIPLLGSVIVFQLSMIYAHHVHFQEDKTMVLHQYKNSVLLTQHKQKTTVFAAQPDKINLRNIQNIAQANFSKIDSIQLLKNVYSVGNKRLLILDSLGIVPENFKPDYLWMTQSPKINFERVLELTNPEKVIIDGSNKPYLIKMWKANCMTKKIPVHITFEQGFYDFGD